MPEQVLVGMVPVQAWWLQEPVVSGTAVPQVVEVVAQAGAAFQE